jgi:hypothetical protein
MRLFTVCGVCPGTAIVCRFVAPPGLYRLRRIVPGLGRGRGSAMLVVMQPEG